MRNLLGFGMEMWLASTSASTASEMLSNCMRPDELLSAAPSWWEKRFSALVAKHYIFTRQLTHFLTGTSLRRLEAEQTNGGWVRRVRYNFAALDRDCRSSTTNLWSENVHDLFLRHWVRCVKKVEYFGWRRDSVLRRRFRIGEPIVAIAHEIAEWRWAVGKLEWLLYVVEESLLRIAELHLFAEKR